MESTQATMTKRKYRPKPQPVPAMENPPIMLRPEVAAYLRFKTVRGLQHAIDRGDVPPGQLRGNRRVWRRADLDRWIEQGMPTVRPQGEPQQAQAVAG